MNTLTFQQIPSRTLLIRFTSHGLKTSATLPRADLYLDCRGVANPIHNGRPSADLAYVETFTDMEAFDRVVLDALRRLTLRRRELSPEAALAKPFVVCCLCAHGVNRSVAMKNALALRFTDADCQIDDVGCVNTTTEVG